MIRVLIADDHTMVRHGLKQIVDAEPQMTTVGEAKSGNEVLNLVRKIPIDVIVLDITMPGGNGLETLKNLKREHPSIAVIMLSMHPKDQYAVRVIKAGAAGYLTKEDAPEELVSAIKKAFRGEKYISMEVAELLADYIELGSSETPHKLLSDREYEVFCGIGKGKSITQISQELFLSVKTISTYRTRIMEKTGMSTNADITRYCIDHNLV
jgi:two-component system invasion response regulator UvrY